MVKYMTTAKFIRLCGQKDNIQRYNAFCKHISIEKHLLDQNSIQIEKILDFVKEIDTSYHKLEKKDKSIEKTFFGLIFHSYIASDLRAMIILSIMGQENQSNIILRHLIGNVVYSFWADLISKFSPITEYLLHPEEWRPYRPSQRIVWKPSEKNYPQRSIRERLERIRLINFESGQGKEFYKRYFRMANMCDILILLSLPICSSCMSDPKNTSKIKYIKYRIPATIRKHGKEDKHAYYKTDFGYYCCFCNRQKLTEGFAMGIPDFDNMLEMLNKAVVHDYRVSESLREINHVYSHLSEEFVHFSTDALPDTKPEPFNSINGKVMLWGLDGIIFFIDIMRPIMNYYFKELLKHARKLNKN
jgi:hypothetical protein